MQTGAVQIDDATVSDHPFAVLYDLGFKVTVNTDNRLMSGTTLTKELELLVDVFDYTLADLETFQLNAAEAAFQDLEQREELMDMISEGFADFA
jgi:adenosine deaminase